MDDPGRDRLRRWIVPQGLSSPHFDLELLRVAHAEEMVAVLDDSALHTFTGGRPSNLAELVAKYERQCAGRSTDGSQQWLNWVMRRRDDGCAVGTLQATLTEESDDLIAELAWVVVVPYQHRGYARESAQTVVSWLRKQGVTLLQAHVHPDHPSSQRVAGATGMSPTEIVVDGETRWQI